MGELLSTDELVQEFLTQNPHFVSATPSGSAQCQMWIGKNSISL